MNDAVPSNESCSGPEKPSYASEPGRQTTNDTQARRIELVAGTTRVVFGRSGDRWEHEVRLVDGRCWRSVEGPGAAEDDPRWPASPPVVEVSRVAAGDRPALLGVGRAGRSHYSLCVTPFPDAADTLLFDVACRVHEPAMWLGSTYAACQSGEPCRLAADHSVHPPATVRWAYTVGPAGIRVLS